MHGAGESPNCPSLFNGLQDAEPAPTPVALVHVQSSFGFLVHLPLSRAAALFGPLAERDWAGKHWNPEFLYPQPGKDVEGAVFTTQHGPHESVWVTALLDVADGRVRYVSVVPGMMASIIDVRLTSVDPSSTSVKVTHIRTALNVTANQEVQALGQRDHERGPHWQEAIQIFLNEPRHGPQFRM
jgi:hypothetical protein